MAQTTRETLEQNKLIVRASLGRWRHPDGRWCLIQEKQFGVYDYEEQEFLASYTPIRKYGTREHEIQFNIIIELKRQGFNLVEPKFPELQEHFRNGEPITGATVLADFIETPKKQAKRPQTGLEAMIAAFKTGK